MNLKLERVVICFDYTSVGSTSSRARELAALNPGASLLVSAREQTAGRGRSGRVWRSPAGGAWFSLAWPTCAPHEHLVAAPLVAGLAVRQAILDLYGESLGERLKLKWPNDLLLKDSKLAGILCEQTVLPQRAARTLILGVGINANVDPAALGEDLRHPATSLANVLGHDVDVRALVQRAAARMSERLRGLERVGFGGRDLSEARQHLAWRDRCVTLQRGSETLRGELANVDDAGRLVLQTATELIHCDAGEIASLRPAEALKHQTCSIPPAEIC